MPLPAGKQAEFRCQNHLWAAHLASDLRGFSAASAKTVSHAIHGRCRGVVSLAGPPGHLVTSPHSRCRGCDCFRVSYPADRTGFSRFQSLFFLNLRSAAAVRSPKHSKVTGNTTNTTICHRIAPKTNYINTRSVHLRQVISQHHHPNQRFSR